MKEQVEQRLSFLETGEATEKNVDVMKEVLDELKAENLYVDNREKIGQKKSKSKSKKPAAKVEQDDEEEEVVVVKKSKKKVKGE